MEYYNCNYDITSSVNYITANSPNMHMHKTGDNSSYYVTVALIYRYIYVIVTSYVNR